MHSEIGQKIVAETSADGLKPEDVQLAVPAILAAVGLAHDMGNPPFGHQGEYAKVSNDLTARNFPPLDAIPAALRSLPHAIGAQVPLAPYPVFAATDVSRI